ncbi:Translin-associated factor X-interacting protein 1 [Irineochytrium annulatum]|nr:Translin-associated factor X-interacting protein 1 [Irineochytrium annulatum]
MLLGSALEGLLNQRWRKLGREGGETLTLTGATLVNRRPKARPIHHEHHHSNHKQVHLPHHRPAWRIKEDRSFVHGLLERLTQEQKRDVTSICFGHLNHDNLNGVLADAAGGMNAPRKRSPQHGAGQIQSGAAGVPLGRSVGQPVMIPTSLMGFAGRFEEGMDGMDSREELMTMPAYNTGKQGTGLAHVDVPENMQEMLAKFDTIRIRPPATELEKGLDLDLEIAADEEGDMQVLTKAEGSTEKGKSTQMDQPAEGGEGREIAEDITVEDEALAQAKARQFLPACQLNFTKVEQYSAMKAVEHGIIETEWNYKRAKFAKNDKIMELRDFVKKELKALGCPPKGPDLRRLQVYSACFDKIIAEFKTFGPILAEVKAEYDGIINSFNFDQAELDFLRTKVRKLLAQNENRLLLKFERKKSNQLEKTVERLKNENENLRAELKRKLAIYATYLPASVLHEKRREEPLLSDVENTIKTYGISDDPISLYERRIEMLTNDVCVWKLTTFALIVPLEQQTNEKASEIESLKKSQVEDFIPKATGDKLSDHLKETEMNYDQLRKKSDEMQQELTSKQLLVTKLEAALREKEEQYQFLIGEYTGLTEAYAKGNKVGE